MVTKPVFSVFLIILRYFPSNKEFSFGFLLTRILGLEAEKISPVIEKLI